MKRPSTPPEDSFQIRCPRLGHEIYFSYCVQENMGNPCFKILDCWFRYFDVVSYLKSKLTEEQWGRVAEHHPKPKMVSLVELIEKAKQNKKETGS